MEEIDGNKVFGELDGCYNNIFLNVCYYSSTTQYGNTLCFMFAYEFGDNDRKRECRDS